MDFHEKDKVTLNCTPVWNSTEATRDSDGSDSSEIPLSRIVLTTFLFAVVTVLGNMVVLLAFEVVRKLTKVNSKFFV